MKKSFLPFLLFFLSTIGSLFASSNPSFTDCNNITITGSAGAFTIECTATAGIHSVDYLDHAWQPHSYCKGSCDPRSITVTDLKQGNHTVKILLTNWTYCEQVISVPGANNGSTDNGNANGNGSNNGNANGNNGGNGNSNGNSNGSNNGNGGGTCGNISISPGADHVTISGGSKRSIEYASHTDWKYHYYCNNDCSPTTRCDLPAGKYRMKVTRMDWTVCEKDVTIGGGANNGNGNNGNSNGNNGNGNNGNANGNNGENGNSNGNNGNNNDDNGGNGSTDDCSKIEVSISGNTISVNSDGTLKPHSIQVFDEKWKEIPACENGLCTRSESISVLGRRGPYIVKVLTDNWESCEYTVNINPNPQPCLGARYSPVCGVDGKTYDNSCILEQAGVLGAYAGECRTVTTCDLLARITFSTDLCAQCLSEIAVYEYLGQAYLVYLAQNVTCADGQTRVVDCNTGRDFCVDGGIIGATQCTDFFAGATKVETVLSEDCEDGGCICTLQYDPVCGADGKTYGNACQAGCAGVAIVDNGECGANSNCDLLLNEIDIDPCDPTIEEIAIYEFQGEKYLVSVPSLPERARDAPTVVSNCRTGDFYCSLGFVANPQPCIAFFEEAVKVEVIVNTIEECPGCICPAVALPVCGVDGKTYGNSCEAACAGVAVAYDGMCGPQACADRRVLNTNSCLGTTYGGYLNLRGIDALYVMENGRLVENTNGTAQLTGTWRNRANASVSFEVAIRFYERQAATYTRPKPKTCGDYQSGIYYYKRFSGSLTGQGQVAGSKLSVSNFGGSFQVGMGANITEPNNVFGASGWFTIAVDAQPTTGWWLTPGSGGDGQQGDININLTGAANACEASSRSAEFTNFNAFEEDRTVALEWVTNSTYRSDHYILEKSIDGENFEVLSTIQNESFSPDAAYFTNVDENPLLGINYYRLKQVFNDGAYAFSEVRAIEFKVDLQAVAVFPNPAQDEIYVNLSAYAGKKGTITISNQFGGIVEELQFKELPATLVKIEVSAFTNGLYFLSTKIDKNKFTTQKLMISRMY